MTVESATASASYTGNGSTTVFTVPFYFLVDTDLKVTRKSAATGLITTLVLNSDYTLTGAGSSAGGSLTTSPALPNLDEIYIERNVVAVQETAYPSNSPFPSASHERALDRLTMLTQQILAKLTFGLFRDPLASTYDLGRNTLSNIANAVDAQDVPSLVQTQALVTGAATGIVPSLIVTSTDLASTATGKGSKLIAFIQRLTGAVSRWVEDKLAERISPEDFGAIGDGVADDLAALTAASNYLLSTTTGGKLEFSPGKTYAVSALWSIPKTVGKQIIIEGNGSILTKKASYNGAILYYGEPTGTVAGYPLICRDVRFVGLGTNCTGLYLEYAGNSHIDNCTFDGGNQGIYLINGYATKVTGSQFLNMTVAGIYCASASNNLTVDKCNFSQNSVDVQFAVACYNIALRDNDFEGGSACVYLAAGGSNFLMDGNYIESKTNTPIQFGASVTSFTFTNNWLSYNTGTQAWTNISSGVASGNIFWNQAQTQDVTVNDFDLGNNTFAGTSNALYRQWTAPTLLNGFTNVGGAWALAGYTKSSNGKVSLRGMVTAAADNDAFLLPVGSRPSQDITFATLGAAAGACHVIVRSTGYVSVYRASDATAELGSINFYAGG